MTPFKRGLKQIVIVVVYLALFSAAVALLYFLFRKGPTCTDKKLNQGETEVDCGGPCAPCPETIVAQDVTVLEKKIVPAGAGKYDLLVKVKNPNPRFGVENFDYVFVIPGIGGNVAVEVRGSNFVLPTDEKYIFAFNVESPENISAFDFKISSLKWAKFSEYQEPDISVFEKVFNLTSSGAGFAELKAKMKNKSGFDFRKIKAKAVIRNGQGEPIAVNETGFDDVRSDEEREIILKWNDAFAAGDVSALKVEIEPEVDIFSQENFMKKYGTPGQYGTYN
jgi:hypothetical protein